MLLVVIRPLSVDLACRMHTKFGHADGGTDEENDRQAGLSFFLFLIVLLCPVALLEMTCCDAA